MQQQQSQVTPKALLGRLKQVGLPANVFGTHDGVHRYWALVNETNLDKQIAWVCSMAPVTCEVEHRCAN